MSAARRFFVEGTQELGGVVEIGGSDARKIGRVLRLRPADRIEIVDSAATAFAASIDSIGSVVRATLLQVLASPQESGVTLLCDVAQAVPKAQRMEFVVEKCTELGANAFLPFYCERSAARSVGAQKLARWERLARAAAQQSGRRDVPKICDPVRFDALLERFAAYDAVLFAWELAPQIPLRERIAALPAAGRALVVVGPEGGFTHDEADAAEHRGATMLSLGARILRTDTAAVAVLAVIGALTS
ncbi:MAG: RsmE family RNA methyltransferase [Candidatus Cybelea sp.]